MRTWSRLRHSSRSGPLPLRSYAWPLGVPSLAGRCREEVDDASRCLRHCLSILGIARQRSFETELILLHLEDFGQALTGTPASIWQLSETRSLARSLSLHRWECYRLQVTQCCTPNADGRGSDSPPNQFMSHHYLNDAIVVESIARRPRETRARINVVLRHLL